MDDEQIEKKINLKEYEIGDTLRIEPFFRIRIAKHKKTNKYFGLKMIKKKEILDAKQGDHVLNEISVLKKIKSFHGHPFCVTLDGITQNEKYIYISTELINGGELFSYLRGAGKIPVEQTK